MSSAKRKFAEAQTVDKVANPEAEPLQIDDKSDLTLSEGPLSSENPSEVEVEKLDQKRKEEEDHIPVKDTGNYPNAVSTLFYLSDLYHFVVQIN